MRSSGDIVIAAALLFASSIYPSDARAQLAETPEEASMFLVELINNKLVDVQVGDSIHEDMGGAGYKIPGTHQKYSKSMFGNWKEVGSASTWLILQYDVGLLPSVGPSGERDACSMLIPRIDIPREQLVVNSYDPGPLRVTVSGQKTEIVFNDDKDRIVLTLKQDPLSLRLAPRSIDWARVEAHRWEDLARQRHVFNLLGASHGVAPFTSLSVASDVIADHVDNAIRVLQLGCDR